MFDKGAIPDGCDTEFGLIETLLWSNKDGFFLLNAHLDRLAQSASVFDFNYQAERVNHALSAAVTGEPGQHLRVRVVVSKSGLIETSVSNLQPATPETCWRVILAKDRFVSSNPLLRHKTTCRSIYEEPLAKAAKEYGADEVLFLNENDELCEGARSNLFIPHEDHLLTPSLSSGLLPGTFRAHLLAQGRAIEKRLRTNDLKEEFFMGNSVRGLVRARLIG